MSDPHVQLVLQALSPHLPRLRTPALIVDLDAAAHNVAAMLARTGGPARWRPHVKTLKQSRLIGLLLDHGVRHFKCATIEELALTLRCAEERQAEAEVLLAYPLTEAGAAQALSLAARAPRCRIQLLADSPEHARGLERWATDRTGVPVDLFLDVDVGMRRTGSTAERWAEAGAALQGLRRLRPAGLHAYEGHLSVEARAEAFAGYDALCALASRLLPADGRACLVTSGSHSYAHALAHPGLASGRWTHQVSPGTIVLNDLRTALAARELGLRQAAWVASRVVSTPGEDRVTLDAGSKALAPDRPAPNCAVVGLPGAEPLVPSEEHLPVRVPAAERPAPGALFLLVPDHVCTTVNLYREALYVSGGEVAGHGPVEAAGHGLWIEG